MTQAKAALLAGALAVTGSIAASEEKKSPLTLDLGNDTTVTLYGYIKADAIWDDGYDLGDTTSGIKNIGLPTGPAAGEFDRQHLRESRFGFDVKNPNVFARFEWDFFGKNNNPRLRHAYIDSYNFIIGQNWTNYMSVENLADTVDFQGALGLPFARLPQVRYTFNPTPDWRISASVEEDIGNSSDVAFTLAARYGFDNNMVRLSGLWRDTTLAGNPVKGWGLHLATVLRLWEGGTIKAAIGGGDGTADILGAGVSGSAVYFAGDTVGYKSGGMTISQQVTDKLKLAITGSLMDLDRATGTNTDKLNSVHVSAFYKVHRTTTLMLEFYRGHRTQGNGAKFRSDRVQAAIKYTF